MSWENRIFAYAKTKTQISFAVTAKLISFFVFATRIVQSLYFLNPKFQASSHLVWLYRPVCVGPGRKPRRPVFSERGSYINADPICGRNLGTLIGHNSTIGTCSGHVNRFIALPTHQKLSLSAYQTTRLNKRCTVTSSYTWRHWTGTSVLKASAMETTDP